VTAKLDHPGEISWIGNHQATPVLGKCPHTRCRHLGHGVVAWGPSIDRYELVQCGSPNYPESDEYCSGQCRAWADAGARIVTDWLYTPTDLYTAISR